VNIIVANGDSAGLLRFYDYAMDTDKVVVIDLDIRWSVKGGIAPLVKLNTLFLSLN
jgi:hypothetical protein